MKKLLPTLISIIFFFNTQAQIVTGFNNITDTDGNTHSLNTYLNDGKFVVLNFYLLTCGNCMATAPMIESIYQNYGQNQCNVVVLSFNITSPATNTDCDNFATTYGNASPPNFNYTEASWGQFYNIHGGGFAQTYVITPDGDSVIYAHAGGVLNQPAIESVLNNSITNTSTNITSCDSYTWPVNGITYTASGIYTHPSPCPSYTDTLNLTITSATVVANTTSSSICIGSPTILTGSGTAVTYTWDNGVTDGLAFNPTTTTTYTVTGTDASACSNTAQITVTVNPLPIVTANANLANICMGEFITLTGFGASTYTWDNSVIDGVSFIPNTTTTYTVTGMDVNACINTDMITVIVNPLPLISAPITNVSCNGFNDGVIVASATGTPPFQYSLGGGLSQSTGIFPNLSAGTYYIDVTDVNSCTSNQTVIITEPLPLSILVDSTDETSALNDGSAIAAINGGTAPYIYTWNNGIPSVSTQTTSTITNLAPGLHIIAVTDANGCVILDSTTVNAYTSTSVINIKNINKTLMKITNLLGRETKGTKNEVLFYIYDDGTVEKRIVIE
jgi:thiol-disulfide isomerase/thioredoxin